jgi:DNA polymerase-3 subunit gamma/tau
MAPVSSHAPVSLITVNQVAAAPAISKPLEEVVLNNFAETVRLFETRREPILSNYLMRHVCLVRFEQGRIELNVDEEVPTDFAGRVGKSLSDWTNNRWMIILSREPGQEPLQVQLDKIAAKEKEEIKSHPLVAAVLEKFAGAEVINIIKE